MVVAAPCCGDDFVLTKIRFARVGLTEATPFPEIRWKMSKNYDECCKPNNAFMIEYLDYFTSAPLFSTSVLTAQAARVRFFSHSMRVWQLASVDKCAQRVLERAGASTAIL